MQAMADPSINRQRLILTTAHIFIGIGLIFIHVYHTSSVFEATTNFSKLNRLERQMQFQHEDALYLYVYHTIAEAKDFRTGLEQIARNNYTEYLNTVNGIERFSIFPEIVIAYLYKQFVHLTTYYNIPTVSCWEQVPTKITHLLEDGSNRIKIDGDDSDDDIIYRHHLYYYYDQHNSVICEGPGLPIFFYLEMVWYLGGLSVFTLYIFATFLSRHILVGLSAVVYYFCIHNDATRLQTNPAARDNFAFPFIFGQIYFLTVWLEQHNRRYEEIDQQRRNQNTNQSSETSASADNNEENGDGDETMVNFWKMDHNEFKLGFFTAFAILAWDFSTYIFATQIAIVLLMTRLRLIKRRHIFLQNFLLAHITARLFINMLKFGWIEFHHKPMTLDCTVLITLLLYVVQRYPTKKQRQRKLERIVLCIFLVVMALSSLVELLSEKNLFSHYADILLSKLYLKSPSFSTMLNLCRSEYGLIDSSTLTVYNCLFVSKFLIVFVITWSANWLKKRRRVEENPSERIQRAKNYLLEDYLEENKMSMVDLANIDRNKEIQKCMNLLECVNYDYDRYKYERCRLQEQEIKERPQLERNAFLIEVKKFKNEISEKDGQNTKVGAVLASDKSNNIDEQENPTESSTTTTTTFTQDAHQSEANQNSSNIKSSRPSTSDFASDNPYSWRTLLTIERPEYFYNLLQTAILVILTVLILKVKYVLTPFLCLIASTFPLQKWIPRSYSLWIVYLTVSGSCVLDLGIQNIRQQYYPKRANETAYRLEQQNLYDMLKWIKTNTDRTAVFAGPEDIITTVLLATGRPIVNHPLNSHPEMGKRTKIVHSILSKQDSNTVYAQLAQLKIDYIIVSHRECFLGSNLCTISELWDIVQPEYQNNIKLCAELFQRANLNFLKVFHNENFMILKIFERFQIDLNLIQLKLQEKNM